MPNYTQIGLSGEYKAKWEAMEVPNRAPMIAAAEKICAHKDRYVQLETETGIPWYFIGLLHYRESDCNFHTHLHNGDSLNERTYHVPAGRPRVANAGEPPFTFDHSAQDALQYEGFTAQKEWSLVAICYNGERYNGWGYRAHGYPSPYLWAGSNQYHSGKYVADGVFDPSHVDTQLGIMPILNEITRMQNIHLVPAIVAMATATPAGPSEAPAPAPAPVVLSPKANIPRPTTAQMNRVSRKHWWNDFMQNVAALFGVGGVSLQGLNMAQLQQTKSTMDFLKDFGGTYGPWIVIGVCFGLVLFFMYQKSLMKTDVQEARSTPSGGEVPPHA